MLPLRPEWGTVRLSDRMAPSQTTLLAMICLALTFPSRVAPAAEDSALGRYDGHSRSVVAMGNDRQASSAKPRWLCFCVLSWIPPKSTRIKAVMFLPNNTDTVKIGEHPAMRAMAAKHHVAILFFRNVSGSLIENPKDPKALNPNFQRFLTPLLPPQASMISGMPVGSHPESSLLNCSPFMAAA